MAAGCAVLAAILAMTTVDGSTVVTVNDDTVVTVGMMISFDLLKSISEGFQVFSSLYAIWCLVVRVFCCTRRTRDVGTQTEALDSSLCSKTVEVLKGYLTDSRLAATGSKSNLTVRMHLQQQGFTCRPSLTWDEYHQIRLCAIRNSYGLLNRELNEPTGVVLHRIAQSPIVTWPSRQ